MKFRDSLNNQLKPCPFCGGKAELSFFNIDYGTVTVGCSNEDCDITMGKGFFDNKEAIEHWNRRVEPLEEKKYKYHIYKSAEGCTSGSVILTKKEAMLINSVLNTSNWSDLEEESWSGSCWIDIENPIRIP